MRARARTARSDATHEARHGTWKLWPQAAVVGGAPSSASRQMAHSGSAGAGAAIDDGEALLTNYRVCLGTDVTRGSSASSRRVLGREVGPVGLRRDRTPAAPQTINR